MRLILVLGVVGHLLRLFALAFVPPAVFAFVEAIALHEGFGDVLWAPVPYVAAGLVSFFAGRRMAKWFPAAPVVRRSEALAVVAAAWLGVAIVGAVPYLFHGLRPIDAFFESLSGFTTTGATILTDFSRYDDAFYLWRAMTQWFGGLGVIALFVVVLPRLGIAGRQLFFAEASTAPGEAVSPQVREGARRLWILYIALTALQTISLSFTGLPLYESIVHSLTTLSAGGFSPHHLSIAGYRNDAAEWVIVLFMILSGTSFTLQYRAFTGRPRAFFKDGEFLVYLFVIVFASVLVAFMLPGAIAPLDALRTGFFQVASLVSSTGYASTDFNLWGDGIKAVLLVVMLIGGCAGSACGGPKVIRYLLTAKFLRREVTQVLHPRAVIPVRYKGVKIPETILRAVLTLVLLYLIGYGLVGALVVVIEPSVDLATGFSAALACFGNIGPAFGEAGPMGSYASFAGPTKMLLALSMWIGRLEIVTVIALFHPHVWRNLQWRGRGGERV